MKKHQNKYLLNKRLEFLNYAKTHIANNGLKQNTFKDISSKYISPPSTTDFGIMFLPIEGLFAEVLREPGIMENLRQKHKIALTGPTTLSALLNSLQMGFRTLLVQERSSEVWNILSAVKSEFATLVVPSNALTPFKFIFLLTILTVPPESV